MKPVRRRRGAALAGVALLLAGTLVAAPDVAAQFPGERSGVPGGGRPRQGDGPGARGGQRIPAENPDENFGNQVEYRLELLREDLRLEPAQQGRWRTLAGQVVAFAEDLNRERRPEGGSTQGTALQQIDRTVDVARNRLTALEEIGVAAKNLYDVLTPEQRTLADARLAGIIPSPAAGRPAGTEQGPGRASPSSEPWGRRVRERDSAR